MRGFGRVYRPTYRRKNGERHTSSFWWIQYSHRGRTYRQSSNSLIRTDAQRLLKAFVTDCEPVAGM